MFVLQKHNRKVVKSLSNFDFLLVEVYFTNMKKILIAVVVLANMSFSAIACEFHGGGGYYSPYDWNSGGFNQFPIPIEETSTASSDSEKVRPDFRYNRAKPPVNDEDSSVEEQDESKS